MKDVGDYLKVRNALQIEGLSKRAAARQCGMKRITDKKAYKKFFCAYLWRRIQ